MISFDIENSLKEKGFVCVCGVDEAGRGPLAGPVFAGACILPEGFEPGELNDSKKLSEKKRDIIYDKIIESGAVYAVGSASEREIDEINILNAAFLAMKRAVDALSVKPDALIVDGNRKPDTGYKEFTVVKGDALSYSIAAASVLAKVSRDRYMLELDKSYPEYGFAKHKGYGTKYHYEMLKKYGISPVHRLSFLKNLSEK